MRSEFRTLCLALALSTSACGAPETAMTSQNSASAEAAVAEAAPTTAELEKQYQRNPSPKQPYEIVLSVAQAPGPFAAIEGTVRYEAPGCVYIPDPIAGVPMHPVHSLPVQFAKNGENTYAATVYADAMLDGDYLGKGPCHWELAGVNATLKASGAEADTDFLIGALGKDVLAQQAVTKHYARQNYPRAEMAGFPDAGNADRASFKPELQDTLFSITLTPKAGTP